MADELTSRCQALLEELGLIATGSVITATALTGGVASDIAKVTTGTETYCVKFALPKLRVAADWFAPVERNFAEYQWLKFVSELTPEASLHLYGHSATQNGFVMSFLEGSDIRLLKTELLEGRGQTQDAVAIGRLLGNIHQTSTRPSFDSGPFHNSDDFYKIRIEPYLVYTATQYSALAPLLHEVASSLYDAQSVLIHGDVSPKNILMTQDHPYILDAECATMGDPCFDIAFCLNHFVLKALHVQTHTSSYLSYCTAFWDAYRPAVTWEDPAALEARFTRLLPLLLLARIDGKSPVEYLTEENRTRIRALSIHLIEAAPTSLSELLHLIEEKDIS